MRFTLLSRDSARKCPVNSVCTADHASCRCLCGFYGPQCDLAIPVTVLRLTGLGVVHRRSVLLAASAGVPHRDHRRGLCSVDVRA